tara:strand:+ start:80 stop:478 length:399 start_codon:yes stop_codon:yes gene_type:complete
MQAQGVKEFTETAEFFTEYDALVAQADNKFIVYLTGGENAEGVNWCPDCVAAKPAITSKILEKTSLQVLKGVVVQANTWCGVADHPYKAHKTLKAGGVPSVMLVCDGQVMMRAESGDDFANDDLLKTIADGE